MRRLTAEQIDQVVTLLRSKNEEYLALGGTGRIGAANLAATSRAIRPSAPLPAAV